MTSNTTSESVPPGPTPHNEPLPPEKEEAEEEEGVRASQLRKVFNTALERSVKTCTYENFSKCFPTPAKRAPEVLQDAWRQMCGFWEGSAKVFMALCDVIGGGSAL